jgi:hypothetical protein
MIEWVTYTRSHRGQEIIVATKQMDESRPGTASGSREATHEEIMAELQRRAQFKIDRQKLIDFEEREEFRHAKSIGFILEFMTFDNHPLDRLTKREWFELYKKLSKAKGD